jgi:hypothetical protein
MRLFLNKIFCSVSKRMRLFAIIYGNLRKGILGKIVMPFIQQGVRFYPQHRTVANPAVFRYNFYQARGNLARGVPYLK